jgi:hypothetical protein
MPPESIETYLKCSKSSPLYIHIVLDDEEVPPSLPLVIAHSHRWATLFVEASEQFPFVKLFMMLKHISAGVLHSLRIDASNITPESGELSNELAMLVTDAAIMTGGAPALTSFSVLGLGMKDCLPPLSMISDLRLYVPDSDSALITHAEFCNVMNNLPRLTNLLICGEIVSRWKPKHPAVELPSLHSLQIENSCTTNGSPADFLWAVSCPKLVALALVGISETEFESLFEGASDSTPHCPSLQILVIVESEMEEDSPRQLYHHFPNITHLALLDIGYRTGPQDAIFEELCPDENEDEDECEENSSSWLGLTTLTVTSEVDSDILCSFLERRTSAGSPITRLRLSTQYDGIAQRPDWPQTQCAIEDVEAYVYKAPGMDGIGNFELVDFLKAVNQDAPAKVCIFCLFR